MRIFGHGACVGKLDGTIKQPAVERKGQRKDAAYVGLISKTGSYMVEGGAYRSAFRFLCVRFNI